MAPRETPRVTPKVQRNISTKTNATITKSSPVTVKKVIRTRNTTDKSNIKMTSTKVIEPKQKTNTVPKVSTPKSKENKPTIIAGSVTKSAKKAMWKRRPKPAHSGVPVPEKMKRLLERQLQDSD